MYKVFSLINAPTPFLWEKSVQNLSERMPFLELLNCNAAKESYRLIMT